MGKVVILLALIFSTVSASAVNMLVRQSNRQLFLGVDNSYTLRGPIEGGSTNKAMKALSALVKKRGTENYALFLVLDTPGGNIDDGEAFIQYAKTIRNLHTITLFAASMGSAIVEALPGKRLIVENGTLMFHRAKLGLEGQIAEGEFESRYQWYRGMVETLETRNASRMGMEYQDYKKRVKDEMWFRANQSLAENAADAIIDIRCTQELIEQNEVILINVLIFTLKFKFSSCPLFRIPEVSLDTPEQKNAYNQYRGYLKNRFSPGTIQ